MPDLFPDDGVDPDGALGSAVDDPSSSLAEKALNYNHIMLLGPAEPGYFSTPSTMPGALIEPLYLTDPFEGSIANSSTGQHVIASGIAQGIGQALLEATHYDSEGQPLTGSYMDYALPRAGDLVAIDNEFHPVPARTNLLGAKGCGEAGCAGALPAVMNAVVDALRPRGVRHLDMPATPERLWRAISGPAGSGGEA